MDIIKEREVHDALDCHVWTYLVETQLAVFEESNKTNAWSYWRFCKNCHKVETRVSYNTPWRLMTEEQDSLGNDNLVRSYLKRYG